MSLEIQFPKCDRLTTLGKLNAGDLFTLTDQPKRVLMVVSLNGRFNVAAGDWGVVYLDSGHCTVMTTQTSVVRQKAKLVLE